MTSYLFCPNCGQRSENGLCTQCFLERFDLVKCPLLLLAKVCPTCGSFFRNGKWVECDLNSLATSTVRSQLNINPAAEDVRISLVPETLGENMRVHVHVDAMVRGRAVSEDADVDVRIERKSCDRCRLIAGGYYEAIVQLRAENRFPASEERSRCKDIAANVINQLQKRDRMAFISDIKELKEGIDIYVVPIHAGDLVSKAITEKLGGQISRAAKLAGRREGKEVYRVSFAVRLPQFMVGDILSLGDLIIDITSMGKRIVGRDLKTGARFNSDMKDMVGAELLCHRSDAKTTILTMVQDDEIQVLDPDSYEPITLLRPAFLNAKGGDEVSVIKTHKCVFVLPD
ncbi:MAG: NMD3-related protein [Methanocellales archaeon]|nr:NMD3-related protein [Methanocellales archaeon]MDD3290944.1 NMD3-related protein [Methanocellales archaeon]MDD5234829.1 NMD3-related protein [Methanocellales archaeon]MDD5484801.1 NMD3-related protein [Methanocellales archaeon]